MIPHPPAIGDYAITQSKRLRFTAAAAVSQNITYQNLLDTVLIGAGNATPPTDLFFQVKVRSIKVWALPVIGQSSTVTVIFNGTTAGSQGDRVVHTDASMGIEPAFINARPREKTLASMWQTSVAQLAFFLECPTGSIIDVSLDFRSDVTGSSVNAQNSALIATIGAMAFRGLDGLAVATSKFTIPTALLQL